MAEDLWLRRYHVGRQDAVRLVCFPHAGGAASFYYSLSARLAPEMEVLSVQYPGRQDRRRESALGIPELADAVAGVLARRAGNEPVVLFGHSFGALVAFEVAHRLSWADRAPQALVVSGRRGPDLDRPESIRSDAPVPVVLREIRRLAGTDERLLGDDEMLQLLLPAVRADYRALETYRPVARPPLAVPVFGLVGDIDPVASVDDVRTWAVATTGSFRLEVLRGGHFYLNASEGQLADLLMAAVGGTV